MSAARDYFLQPRFDRDVVIARNVGVVRSESHRMRFPPVFSSPVHVRRLHARRAQFNRRLRPVLLFATIDRPTHALPRSYARAVCLLATAVSIACLAGVRLDPLDLSVSGRNRGRLHPRTSGAELFPDRCLSRRRSGRVFVPAGVVRCRIGLGRSGDRRRADTLFDHSLMRFVVVDSRHADDARADDAQTRRRRL